MLLLISCPMHLNIICFLVALLLKTSSVAAFCFCVRRHFSRSGSALCASFQFIVVGAWMCRGRRLEGVPSHNVHNSEQHARSFQQIA